MEFTSKMTPKSLTPVHSGAHSSRGKSYLNNFRKNTDKAKLPYTTPPRKFSQVTSYPRKSVSASKLKFLPRTRNILQNSQTQNNSKENPKPSKWISKTNDTETPTKAIKRPFKSLNSSLDTSDPYNVFSDDDTDTDDIFLSAKHEKILQKDLDKENNLRSPVKRNTPKVYSSSGVKKKKTINLLKTNILHDISPKKVCSSFDSGKKRGSENQKVFKFKSIIGKENPSVQTEDYRPTNFIEYPHMIGFPNFGNTCYLNAVLQTIISLQSFIVDLNNILDMVNVSSSSLTNSLWNIIVARQKLDSFSVKNSLRTMKGNVEKIDGSFSGFKMQDANEFLTQVLDTVKDEIDKSSLHIQETKTTSAAVTPGKSVVPKNMTKSASIFDSPNSSSPLSLEVKIKENCEFVIDESDLLFLSPKTNGVLEHPSQPKTPNGLLMPAFNSLKGKNKAENNLINPVTNNFEFELFESYKCLGCGATEDRRQKHFALYVNLPSDDSENIQTSIEAYMSEDKRELTCEKCRHKTASFLTSFLQLPRVLIVQMKRYEYKPEQLECIKVSSKVNINVWLHLDKLIAKDSCPPPQFSTKLWRELRTSPLKEIDPSSALNVANQTIEDSEPIPSTLISTPNSKCDTASKEDKDLQEVLIRSLEEVGGDMNPTKTCAPDKEEEEFQEAIRLSLQDTGMCYATQKLPEESELQVQSVEDVEKNGNHSYHLISVISHFGQTTCTGHYVSDVLNIEESSWYHYDDESVTSVPESVVLSEGRQKNGYIFFYVHRDTYHELRRNKT